MAVVVVDAEHEVQLWNDTATDLWGLRGEEVDGRSFLELDIGLPIEHVRDSVRAALSDGGSRARSPWTRSTGADAAFAAWCGCCL